MKILISVSADKKILYIDMDLTLVDFGSGLKQIDQETKNKYRGRDDEIPGIFALMKPNPGAVEAFHILYKLFDTYILSTAPWENPSAWTDKLLWVKEHLGPPATKRLILSHNKNLNRGDFLVDDRTKNGADKFEGELIQFGTSKFPNWNSMVKYLKERV